MHFHFLDPYQPGHSLVHALDPRIKLSLTLAFILTASLAPAGAWFVTIILAALALAVVIASELGIAFVLRRSIVALPFALAAFPLIFTIKGAPLFEIPLGFVTLSASAAGIERFLAVLIKSWLSIQMAIVLAATTQFPELLLALRAMRVPRLLVTIFGLMWRYLFVLVDEATRLLRARTARSGISTQSQFNKTGGSLAWRAKVAGGMAGNLFLRGYERSDRIYAAMLARGYDGEPRGFALPALRGTEMLMLGIGLLVFLLLSVLARLY